MNVDARAEAWARLQLSGVAPRSLVDLLRAFGSPEGVLGATPAQRRRHAPRARHRGARRRPRCKSVSRPRSPGCASPATISSPGTTADYPRALLEIGDPPPVFYCMGRRELLAGPAFAIVGSRNATAQGCADAEAFAARSRPPASRSSAVWRVGIDAAAHRGGLAHAASSIAVVGTGPDRVYPARNRDLAHDLAARGLVISEFALGTPPLKQNFPAAQSTRQRPRARRARDRGDAVVGLARHCASGAANRDAKCSRCPARSTRRSRRARTSSSAKAPSSSRRPRTSSTSWGFPQSRPPRATQPQGRGRPDAAARAVLRALGYDPADVDTLAARTGLSAATVAAALTALELDGRVNALPGGLWQRVG